MYAVGGAEFAQLLTQDVMNVLSNGATRPVVRKKAALCLLRLIRKAPPDAEVLPASEWAVRMAALLEERDLGVLLGIATLLLGVVSRSYEGESEGWRPCQAHAHVGCVEGYTSTTCMLLDYYEQLVNAKSHEQWQGFR